MVTLITCLLKIPLTIHLALHTVPASVVFSAVTVVFSGCEKLWEDKDPSLTCIVSPKEQHIALQKKKKKSTINTYFFKLICFFNEN